MLDSSINKLTPVEPHGLEQLANRDEAFAVTHPWIRHYEPGVPAHLEIPDQPLTWLLECTASRYPDRTALIYFGRRLSYAELARQAQRFALALQRLGVQKGVRVAIALPNLPQFPIAFYGALLAGAVVVPTNPLYTEREMQHQLTDAGARVLVMLDTFYPMVRAVRQQTPLEHILLTGPADFLPPVLRALYPLSQRRTRPAEPPLSRKELRDDQTLHIMLTLLESHNGENRDVFSIVERVKDVIIASGLKVYPREVEEVLFAHPAVAEAAVTGVPDAYRGETVAAYVVLKAGIEASEDTGRELLQYCRQELAAYKVPTILEFRQSLPKSLIGKVLRRELRAGG